MAEAVTDVIVGNVAGQNAILELDGGTITPAASANPFLTMGTVANAAGVFVMNSGVVTSTNEMWFATTPNAYAAMLLNGGTITATNWIAMGRGGGNTLLVVSGGVLNFTSTNGSVPFGLWLPRQFYGQLGRRHERRDRHHQHGYLDQRGGLWGLFQRLCGVEHHGAMPSSGRAPMPTTGWSWRSMTAPWPVSIRPF